MFEVCFFKRNFKFLEISTELCKKNLNELKKFYFKKKYFWAIIKFNNLLDGNYTLLVGTGVMNLYNLSSAFVAFIVYKMYVDLEVKGI